MRRNRVFSVITEPKGVINDLDHGKTLYSVFLNVTVSY